MEIIFNDGAKLNGYTAEEAEGTLKIRFIVYPIDKIREHFKDELATKKITIDGKAYAGYKTAYITEFTGGITEVGMELPAAEDNKVMQAVVELARIQAQELDDEAAEKVKDLFPTWNANGIEYKTGQRLTYEGILYSVVQDHTSQEDWTPAAAASLFRKLGDPAADIQEWIQPTGAQDAYSKDDIVMHNGKKYKSIADANVWEPGVYGWEEI